MGIAATILEAGSAGTRIAPPPVRTFPLEEVAVADREIESGLTVGKVVRAPGGHELGMSRSPQTRTTLPTVRPD